MVNKINVHMDECDDSTIKVVGCIINFNIYPSENKTRKPHEPVSCSEEVRVPSIGENYEKTMKGNLTEIVKYSFHLIRRSLTCAVNGSGDLAIPK